MCMINYVAKFVSICVMSAYIMLLMHILHFYSKLDWYMYI